MGIPLAGKLPFACIPSIILCAPVTLPSGVRLFDFNAALILEFILM